MAKYHYLKLDNVDEAELIFWLLEEALYKFSVKIPDSFKTVDISKLCDRLELMNWKEE